MKISNSFNNYCYNSNLNLINTLNQKLNTNEKILNSNNYFSSRDELDEFIKRNRISNKITIKNIIIPRKKLTESESTFERNNIFLNILEKNKEREKCNYSEKNNINNKSLKDNSFSKKINNNEIDKDNKLIKANNFNNIMKMNELESKSSKNSIINIERNSILNSVNKIKEIEEIKKVDNIDKNKNNSKKNNDNKINELDTIKLFDKNKIEENNENNNKFEKVNGKNGDCRYFNLFGNEGEDLSFTYKERDYSGIMDSSTSNNIQMDFFLKESPINIFKANKSENQSNNISNNNEI